MKILFSLGSFGFLRNFEPAVRLLAQHGHDIHLVADRKDNVGGIKTLELLERDCPERIRHSYARVQKGAFWQPLGHSASFDPRLLAIPRPALRRFAEPARTRCVAGPSIRILTCRRADARIASRPCRHAQSRAYARARGSRQQRRHRLLA